MYKSVDIANYFLKLAEKEGKSIKTMKLLKLAYIAHGFHLGFNDKPLFSEKIEAWRYGPVIPELYFLIKGFGKYTVPSDGIESFTKKKLNEETKKFVGLIWDAYKGFTGYQLSGLTHKENSPWHQVYKDNGVNQSIPDTLISDYYKSLIRDKKIA